MSFINYNWYIALAFCLFFFIGGRQLAEVRGGNPYAHNSVGIILFIFAAPSLLFPISNFVRPIAASAWYNALRSINRIELFSALISPAAAYATYRKPPSPYRTLRASASELFMRVAKPLAFPFCILLISVNFISPLILPLDKETDFKGEWRNNNVYMPSSARFDGPAALINTMYSLNNHEIDEFEAAKGTYTDRSGTEFWYLARFAASKGFRTRFYKPAEIGEAYIPSIIYVTPGISADDLPESASSEPAAAGRSGRGKYIALIARSDDGALTICDPETGRLELLSDNFSAIYGKPPLALAVSAPRVR